MRFLLIQNKYRGCKFSTPSKIGGHPPSCILWIPPWDKNKWYHFYCLADSWEGHVSLCFLVNKHGDLSFYVKIIVLKEKKTWQKAYTKNVLLMDANYLKTTSWPTWWVYVAFVWKCFHKLYLILSQLCSRLSTCQGSDCYSWCMGLVLGLAF